ncbi:MAG: DUF1501 domain-containing protein [Leadbetterella sp.]
MNRRDFVKLTSTLSGGLWAIPQFVTQAASNLSINSSSFDEVLVFIQLNGGNDGLNTVIPFENDLYYSNRKNIAIPKTDILTLENGMGLHPALKDFYSIFEKGNMKVIQNVGYPSPNRSHFRSQEIWQTASDASKFLNQGWLGRYLEIQCKDCDIPAINVDSIDNLALKSENQLAVTFKNPERYKQADRIDPELDFGKNPQLMFARQIAQASYKSMDMISKNLKKAPISQVMYPKTDIGQNLQKIAKLIRSGLSSKIYYTSLSGFDTHNNQLKIHNSMLTQVNDSVKAFYDELTQDGLWDCVTVVLFSEFGRRVVTNGTGTDHGTAGPMFVLGKMQQSSLMGSPPDLNDLDNGDLKFKIDFRSVYASLLATKLGLDPRKIGIDQEALKGLFQ